MTWLDVRRFSRLAILSVALAVTGLAGCARLHPAPQFVKNAVTFPAGEPLALRVNCGGTFADARWTYTDEEGKVWLGDQELLGARPWGFVGGDGLFRSTQFITFVKDTKAPGMMMAERFGVEKYVFRLPPGDGPYTVRLHFMEGYHAMYTPGTRVFSVAINGKPVAEHLDVRQEAGEIAKAIVREAKGVAAPDGKIEIAFTQESKDQRPVVNGIEILGEQPLATALRLPLGDPEGQGVAQLPDLGKPLHRVCCGMVDFLKGYQYMGGDTAPWQQDREWKDGADFGALGGSADPRGVEDKQTPVSRGAYAFERSGLEAYRFKVPAGAKCRVRLHVAETWKDNTAAGKRVFDVVAGEKVLAAGVDPFALSGGLRKAAHVDLAECTAGADGTLEIQFVAKTEQKPLVNGIEVFQVTQ